MLDPGEPEYAFVWSNLVKVDQNGRRPQPEVEDRIARLRLVQTEVRILKPDVVIFFTGSEYDMRLRDTFVDTQFTVCEGDLAKVSSPELPEKSFRTSHPNRWRWIRGQTLERMVRRIAHHVLTDDS
jgi:hypothetical protein